MVHHACYVILLCAVASRSCPRGPAGAAEARDSSDSSSSLSLPGWARVLPFDSYMSHSLAIACALFHSFMPDQHTSRKGCWLDPVIQVSCGIFLLPHMGQKKTNQRNETRECLMCLLPLCVSIAHTSVDWVDQCMHSLSVCVKVAHCALLGVTFNT